jgi:hypothetical protein
MIRDWLVIISAMVAYIRERWDVIAQLIDILSPLTAKLTILQTQVFPIFG